MSVSGRGARQKGLQFERDFVNLNKGEFNCFATRLYEEGAKSGPDVRVEYPPAHLRSVHAAESLLVELKRHKQCVMQKARAIAEKKGADAVVSRGDGEQPWIALPYATFMRLMGICRVKPSS